MAHEFNNLLAAIMGYSEMILEEADNHQKLAADAAQILQASERGRDLVRNILSFTRKIESQPQPLDINVEISKSLGMLEILAPRTVSIETRLARDISSVSMDASHLSQILMNLTTNACHAMPDGGKVVIQTKDISVDHAICLACGESFSGDYVLFCVSDTGHGMDSETIERIYEPFFSTKDVGSGTGLGLSVVLGLVKNQEGHIDCESEVGKGTTFKIFLPVLHAAKTVSDKKELAQTKLAIGTETLLLVDDEKSLRDIAQRYFSDVGYRIHQAGSGEEAVDIYRRHLGKIDLIVLDLGMAGMGGRKCLEEILSINPKARVVIASGYTSDDQDQQALSFGAAAFVGKPFKKIELLKTVRDVLDNK